MSFFACSSLLMVGEGDTLGETEGDTLGDTEGLADGEAEGDTDGDTLGVGVCVGVGVTSCVGVAAAVGVGVASCVGVGSSVGVGVTSCGGSGVGVSAGAFDGSSVVPSVATGCGFSFSCVLSCPRSTTGFMESSSMERVSNKEVLFPGSAIFFLSRTS